MNLGHILFADDDVLAQWTLTEALNQAGFQVTGVCRASDAICALRSVSNFDLLLTDVALPGDISGVELADYWRLAHPGRPVVYATSQPRSEIGRLEDGEHFIRKPCAGDALLRVVEEALGDALLYTVPKISCRRPAWVH